MSYAAQGARNPLTSAPAQPSSRPRHLQLVSAPPRPRPHLIAVPPLTSPSTPNTKAATSAVSPRPAFVQSLAVQAYEVVEGLRAVNHMGSVITLSAARQLSMVRAARRDQRSVTPLPLARPAQPGPVRIDRVHDSAVEAAAVIYLGDRARAVAMRLEWLHGHWRATDIAVL